ncbi:putative Membrane-associated apoptosis protein [Paratrimastix pyriformis]|uniref:Membrane-associated apoptosis protein n=1 Tax=Paratrimastix pyriformis TaxID=342808 RepID=A0ABQ8UUG7_9EUKA|nr:putative Membrane-associated apoptosis protein [Paratrimastix pyriformis]
MLSPGLERILVLAYFTANFPEYQVQKISGFEAFSENRDTIFEECEPVYNLCLDILDFREQALSALNEFSKNLINLRCTDLAELFMAFLVRYVQLVMLLSSFLGRAGRAGNFMRVSGFVPPQGSLLGRLQSDLAPFTRTVEEALTATNELIQTGLDPSNLAHGRILNVLETAPFKQPALADSFDDRQIGLMHFAARRLWVLLGYLACPDALHTQAQVCPGPSCVRRCGGAAVRRCGGAAVRRCGGAAVRRCGGWSPGPQDPRRAIPASAASSASSSVLGGPFLRRARPGGQYETCLRLLLSDGYAVPLFRDEVLLIHPEYEATFEAQAARGAGAKAGASKLDKKWIRDAQQQAVLQSGPAHRYYRHLLNRSLEQALHLLGTAPDRFVAPLAGLALAALGLARAEIQWYFAHMDAPVPKTKTKPRPGDFADPVGIARTMDMAHRLAALVAAPVQVESRLTAHYAQVLAGPDRNALARLVDPSALPPGAPPAAEGDPIPDGRSPCPHVSPRPPVPPVIWYHPTERGGECRLAASPVAVAVAAGRAGRLASMLPRPAMTFFRELLAVLAHMPAAREAALAGQDAGTTAVVTLAEGADERWGPVQILYLQLLRTAFSLSSVGASAELQGPATAPLHALMSRLLLHLRFADKALFGALVEPLVSWREMAGMGPRLQQTLAQALQASPVAPECVALLKVCPHMQHASHRLLPPEHRAHCLAEALRWARALWATAEGRLEELLGEWVGATVEMEAATLSPARAAEEEIHRLLGDDQAALRKGVPFVAAPPAGTESAFPNWPKNEPLMRSIQSLWALLGSITGALRDFARGGEKAPGECLRYPVGRGFLEPRTALSRCLGRFLTRAAALALATGPAQLPAALRQQRQGAAAALAPTASPASSPAPPRASLALDPPPGRLIHHLVALTGAAPFSLPPPGSTGLPKSLAQAEDHTQWPQPPSRVLASCRAVVAALKHALGAGCPVVQVDQVAQRVLAHMAAPFPYHPSDGPSALRRFYGAQPDPDPLCSAAAPAGGEATATADGGPDVCGGVEQAPAQGYLTLAYTEWLTTVFLPRLATGPGIIYSPQERAFVPVPQAPPEAHRLQAYASRPELRALCELLGPAAVTALRRAVLASVVAHNVTRITSFLEINRGLLEELQARLVTGPMAAGCAAPPAGPPSSGSPGSSPAPSGPASGAGGAAEGTPAAAAQLSSSEETLETVGLLGELGRRFKGADYECFVRPMVELGCALHLCDQLEQCQLEARPIARPPAQPRPAQPSPAQPSPAPPSPAQPRAAGAPFVALPLAALPPHAPAALHTVADTWIRAASAAAADPHNTLLPAMQREASRLAEYYALRSEHVPHGPLALPTCTCPPCTCPATWCPAHGRACWASPRLSGRAVAAWGLLAGDHPHPLPPPPPPVPPPAVGAAANPMAGPPAPPAAPAVQPALSTHASLFAVAALLLFAPSPAWRDAAWVPSAGGFTSNIHAAARALSYMVLHLSCPAPAANPAPAPSSAPGAGAPSMLMPTPPPPPIQPLPTATPPASMALRDRLTGRLLEVLSTHLMREALRPPQQPREGPWQAHMVLMERRSPHAAPPPPVLGMIRGPPHAMVPVGGVAPPRGQVYLEMPWLSAGRFEGRFPHGLLHSAAVQLMQQSRAASSAPSVAAPAPAAPAQPPPAPTA